MMALRSRRQADLVLDGLTLDPDWGTVEYDGRTAHLTRQRSDLLKAMLGSAGRPVTPAAIAVCLWPDGNLPPAWRSVISVLMAQLRADFEALGVPLLLQWKRGFGWRLAPKRQ